MNGRIALSTKTLEPEPGDMIKNPQKVYDMAEVRQNGTCDTRIMFCVQHPGIALELVDIFPEWYATAKGGHKNKSVCLGARDPTHSLTTVESRLYHTARFAFLRTFVLTTPSTHFRPP